MMIHFSRKKTVLALFAAVFLFTGLCAEEAKFITVTGKVEVKSGESWTAVKAGDTVTKGTVISTGFKSNAVINFKGTTFTLSPLTRITLEQLAETSEKDDTQLFLDVGTVNASVKKTENRRTAFKVRGTVATASVRGTELQVKDNGSIRCSEGSVSAWATPKDQQKASVQTAPAAAVPKGGESSAFTAAGDIAPEAPVRAIVIAQNQAAAFTAGGVQTPAQTAQNSAAASSTLTTSVAEKEAVSSTGITAVTSATEAAANSGTKSTAIISITISW